MVGAFHATVAFGSSFIAEFSTINWKFRFFGIQLRDFCPFRLSNTSSFRVYMMFSHFGSLLLP